MKLDKAIKLYNELKEIDDKIISLEKFANNVSNGATDMKINLSLVPKVEEKKPEVFGEHGFIKPEYLGEKKKDDCGDADKYYFGGILGSWTVNIEDNKTKVKNTGISITETVDQKVMFMFLQYTIDSYNKRREYLINKLKPFGV